jgi:hypothetical protein
LEMLESDLNLLASHQDQLHRERQRKMQASSDIQYIYIFFDKISMVGLARVRRSDRFGACR